MFRLIISKTLPHKHISAHFYITEHVTRTLFTTIPMGNLNKLKTESRATLSRIDQLLEKYQDDIIYSEYVQARRLNYGYKKNKQIMFRMKKQQNDLIQKHLTTQPLPLTLKLLNENNSTNIEVKPEPTKCETIESKPVRFPFQQTSDIEEIINEEQPTIENDRDVAKLTQQEIKTRLELINKPLESYKEWMFQYECFDDDIVTKIDSDDLINYGTPNSKVPVSDIPCSGCGSWLHCRDSGIPGYIPSEIFINAHSTQQLESIICQRCHFLREYNLALQVNVSPEDYLKVLKTITTRRKALVVLLVDLLDFPCSIWPGIADILGRGRPVMVVGNKIDLLPQDGKGFLARVTQSLERSVLESGFGMSSILHVGLVSARTGFGIEDLITKLFTRWGNRGDIYLVGCTNVGKSSLYNALLRSDYCKSQAQDLVLRATTSPWPGTTLNLLKFPVTRPNQKRLEARRKRLDELAVIEAKERKHRTEQLRSIADTREKRALASLIGHVDRTVSREKDDGSDEQVIINDVFGVKGNAMDTGITKIGVDEDHPDFATGKWCFDTPGVVQPDQITDLLTTDELLLTQPCRPIQPRTFTLMPDTSILIGGIARLDYVTGPTDQSVRFTVFASDELPITIVRLSLADKIYKELLQVGGVLAVPIVENSDDNLTKITENNKNSEFVSERLAVWPGLKAGKELFELVGVMREVSCADIVLSSCGWIAVTPREGVKCEVRAWTPGARGIYKRECLLPGAVTLRGKRLTNSVAYKGDRFYIAKH